MKTEFYKDVDVEFNIPDEVKIESGKSMAANVVLDKENYTLTVKKKERTGKKTSERNYLYQGSNFSLTLNTDTRMAHGTLTLRACEDWTMMREMILKEVNDALNNLYQNM